MSNPYNTLANTIKTVFGHVDMAFENSVIERKLYLSPFHDITFCLRGTSVNLNEFSCEITASFAQPLRKKDRGKREKWINIPHIRAKTNFPVNGLKHKEKKLLKHHGTTRCPQGLMGRPPARWFSFQFGEPPPP